MILLSAVYLGTIRYYSKFFSGEKIVLESHEYYQKQTYRNRCRILTANGVSDLIVPVLKRSGLKTSIKDVKIDQTKNWQHQHWYSIFSAYKNSPYFDYYYDIFEPFYKKRYEFLWDLNENLRMEIFHVLKIDQSLVQYTERFEITEDCTDLRNTISPKKSIDFQDKNFVNIPYYQVFSEKYDFFPDLSIIDLLFCEGPETLNILKRSYIK